MAEALVTVCDECGNPAESTLNIKVQGGAAARLKDVCAEHEAAILSGSRAATRGRPRKKVSAVKPVRRARTKAAATPKRRTTGRRKRQTTARSSA